MAPVFTYESPGRQTYSFFVEELSLIHISEPTRP